MEAQTQKQQQVKQKAHEFQNKNQATITLNRLSAVPI